MAQIMYGDLQVTGRVIAKNVSLYDETFVPAKVFNATIKGLEERINMLERHVFIAKREADQEVLIGEDVLI